MSLPLISEERERNKKVWIQGSHTEDPGIPVKEHTAQQVLTEIKISKSVLGGPPAHRGNVQAQITEKNGKGAEKRHSPEVRNVEMGMGGLQLFV